MENPVTANKNRDSFVRILHNRMLQIILLILCVGKIVFASFVFLTHLQLANELIVTGDIVFEVNRMLVRIH